MAKRKLFLDYESFNNLHVRSVNDAINDCEFLTESEKERLKEKIDENEDAMRIPIYEAEINPRILLSVLSHEHEKNVVPALLVAYGEEE